MIVIILPLPNRNLHPNSRPGYYALAASKKKARADAAFMCRHEMCKARMLPPPRWEKASITATFYFKVNRRRDRDGAASSIKAYQDGLVDAGLLSDDTGVFNYTVLAVDKDNPRLELHVNEVVMYPLDKDATRRLEIIRKINELAGRGCLHCGQITKLCWEEIDRSE